MMPRYQIKFRVGNERWETIELGAAELEVEVMSCKKCKFLGECDFEYMSEQGGWCEHYDEWRENERWIKQG